MLNSELARRLGEAHCSPEDGAIGLLDLLARSGLPVPEGFVFTRECHRRYLGFGASGEASLADELLARLIRDAVLELRPRTLAVRAEGFSRRGLRSMPEVISAVRGAWSLSDLLPRPLLLQRYARPDYTGWSAGGACGRHPARKARCAGVAFHEAAPATDGPHAGIARLTREAGAVAGFPVCLEWGLRDGRWYVLSAVRRDV